MINTLFYYEASLKQNGLDDIYPWRKINGVFLTSSFGNDLNAENRNLFKNNNTYLLITTPFD